MSTTLIWPGQTASTWNKDILAYNIGSYKWVKNSRHVEGHIFGHPKAFPSIHSTPLIDKALSCCYIYYIPQLQSPSALYIHRRTSPEVLPLKQNGRIDLPKLLCNLLVVLWKKHKVIPDFRHGYGPHSTRSFPCKADKLSFSNFPNNLIDLMDCSNQIDKHNSHLDFHSLEQSQKHLLAGLHQRKTKLAELLISFGFW